MEELAVEGIKNITIKQADKAATFIGTAKAGGSTYFLSLEFTRREDGTPRERLFKRRIETFCGKAVRAKARFQLQDMADVASAAVITHLIHAAQLTMSTGSLCPETDLE